VLGSAGAEGRVIGPKPAKPGRRRFVFPSWARGGLAGGAPHARGLAGEGRTPAPNIEEYIPPKPTRRVFTPLGKDGQAKKSTRSGAQLPLLFGRDFGRRSWAAEKPALAPSPRFPPRPGLSEKKQRRELGMDSFLRGRQISLNDSSLAGPPFFSPKKGNDVRSRFKVETASPGQNRHRYTWPPNYEGHFLAVVGKSVACAGWAGEQKSPVYGGSSRIPGGPKPGWGAWRSGRFAGPRSCQPGNAKRTKTTKKTTSPTKTICPPKRMPIYPRAWKGPVRGRRIFPRGRPGRSSKHHDGISKTHSLAGLPGTMKNGDARQRPLKTPPFGSKTATPTPGPQFRELYKHPMSPGGAGRAACTFNRRPFKVMYDKGPLDKRNPKNGGHPQRRALPVCTRFSHCHGTPWGQKSSTNGAQKPATALAQKGPPGARARATFQNGA